MHCKLKYVSVFGEKGEEGKCHHFTKIESQQNLMGQLSLLKISMIHHSKSRQTSKNGNKIRIKTKPQCIHSTGEEQKRILFSRSNKAKIWEHGLYFQH